MMFYKNPPSSRVPRAVRGVGGCSVQHLEALGVQQGAPEGRLYEGQSSSRRDRISASSLSGQSMLSTRSR